AILEGEPVRHRQPLDDGLDLTLAVLFDDGIDAPDRARADKHGALVTHNHGPTAGMAARPDLGLEARWQLDLVEWNLFDRRHQRRHRMAFEAGVLTALVDLGLVDRAEARELGARRLSHQRKTAHHAGHE